MSAIRHVGIIIDGNGRWAQRRGLPRMEGHRQGAERIAGILAAACAADLGCVTIYTFSSQNRARPHEETGSLLRVVAAMAGRLRDDLVRSNFRFRTIGARLQLPPDLRDALDDVERATSGNDGMIVCLAVDYDGRESIVRAARAAMRAGTPGSELDAATLEAFLETRDLGSVDLVIRTGEEQRLSGFLLWEAAYAELRFTPTLWPDFTVAEFLGILGESAGRERRFGRAPGQLTAGGAT